MADQPFGLAWRAPLPPYQQAGIVRLLTSPGVLLADEMGLGKTIQAIGALRVLLRDGTSGPALVVVPSGLVMQWRRQLREWAPELSLSTCTGPPEDRRRRWRAPAQVYLTSFDALRGDMVLPAPLGPRHRGWAVVVADEAQRIKNAHTAISAMVKALPRRRAWALTGTPLENRPDDAASILDFVAPGLYDPAHMVAGLRRVLSQVQLRRRRADVLHDLPPKTVFELAPELLPQQRAAYEVAQREGLVWLRSLGTELRIVHVLELILRLKQICNACPRTGVSAKLDDLLPRLHQVAEAGEKALVFSQFVAAPFGAEAVAAAMKPLNPVLLTGRMSIAARDDAVAQYIRPCDEPGTELGAHRRALADAGCRMPDAGRSSRSRSGQRMAARSLSWTSCSGACSRATSWSCRNWTAWPGPCPTWCAHCSVTAAGAGLHSLAEAVHAGASRGAAPGGPDTQAATPQPIWPGATVPIRTQPLLTTGSTRG